MIYELSINVSDSKIKIIMQDSFFANDDVSPVLHKHIYPEIHAIAEGEAVYLVQNKRHTLKKGDILLIDSGKFHKCEKATENLKFIAFQLSGNTEFKAGRYKTEPSILQSTLKNINYYAKNGDATKIKAYLMLICAELAENKKDKLIPVTDREYIISEYFALNYNGNANIKELADKLGVCTKQASRLVKRYTGNNFRTELSKRRISVAKLLISEGTLSVAEIAFKVGYNSYSGFWKAYNSDRSNKNENF